MPPGAAGACLPVVGVRAAVGGGDEGDLVRVGEGHALVHGDEDGHGGRARITGGGSVIAFCTSRFIALDCGLPSLYILLHQGVFTVYI